MTLESLSHHVAMSNKALSQNDYGKLTSSTSTFLHDAYARYTRRYDLGKEDIYDVYIYIYIYEKHEGYSVNL